MSSNLEPTFCQTITMNKIRNQETKNQDFREITNTTQLDICDYYKVNHPSTLIKSSNSHAAETYAVFTT